MIFRGEYDLRLDPKNRVVLPAAWRAQLLRAEAVQGDGRLSLVVFRNPCLPALEIYAEPDSDQHFGGIDGKIRESTQLKSGEPARLNSALNRLMSDIDVALGTTAKPGRGLIQFEAKMVGHAHLGRAEGLGACEPYLRKLREAEAGRGAKYHERTVKLLGGRNCIHVWNPALYLGWMEYADLPWYSEEKPWAPDTLRSVGMLV